MHKPCIIIIAKSRYVCMEEVVEGVEEVVEGVEEVVEGVIPPAIYEPCMASVAS